MLVFNAYYCLLLMRCLLLMGSLKEYMFGLGFEL